MDARHRPRSTPAEGRRSSFAFAYPSGACGTPGRFTAPAAPGMPTRNRHTRRPVLKGTGQPLPESRRRGHLRFTPLEGSPPRKQVLRLRSARGWTLRLAACPRTRCYCPALPFVRTVARTCTWAVRPLRRCHPNRHPESIARRRRRLKGRHRCGHRSPLHDMKRS